MKLTRFPNGFTNVLPDSLTSELGQLDPTKYHIYFNDFDTYHSAEWAQTAIGTPSVGLIDNDGGALQLANNGAGIGDYILLDGVSKTFTFTPGKKSFYKVKVRYTDVLNITSTFGLRQGNSQVNFSSEYTDNIIAFRVLNAGVQHFLVDVVAIENNTDFTAGFYYNGKDSISYYIDDIFYGLVDSTNVPTIPLAPRFTVTNAVAAVAESITIDYVLVAKER